MANSKKTAKKALTKKKADEIGRAMKKKVTKSGAKNLNVPLPEWLMRAIRVGAADLDVSYPDLVEMAMVDYLPRKSKAAAAIINGH